MQRSCGATHGIRTKTPRSASAARTARAKSPPCPQSIATKLVAEGSGDSPLSRAICAIRARASATCASIPDSQASSDSAASAPACPTELTPKWFLTRSKPRITPGAAMA